MLVAPAVVYPVLVMKALCFALFACAFNLLLGYTGLLSFGHAASSSARRLCRRPQHQGMGLPAGARPDPSRRWRLRCWAGLDRQPGHPAAGHLLRHDHPGAGADDVFLLHLQAPFTGGEDGLQGVPRGKLLGVIDLPTTTTMYYFVLAIFVLASGLIHRVIHSPFGQVLKAIRENEPRAISLGYDAPTSTSCWSSCFRPAWPGWPAPPRRWCSASPR
jgi:branched-chain amino acid transport system permease protein